MRRRIVLLAAGTALLAVLLLAIPLGVLAAHSYLRDERLELQQAAAVAAAAARGDVTRTSPPRVDSTEIGLSVYDRTGRRAFGTGPAKAGDLVRAALGGRQASSTTSSSISVTTPVSDGDQVVAALLLTTSLDAVHQRTVKAWLALAGMCLTAVLVSALAATLLARRLIRPVDRLTAVAGKVGAGDLTARAEPSGVAEIDALANTLNDSVERIEAMIGRERALSGEVSHQLRTPLSGLRLDLEAAARSVPPSDHQTATDLANALAAVDRLETTINDVISLARDLPVAQRVELVPLLESATRRWRGVLAASSRPLRISVDPTSPRQLHISLAAATQILDILIDNACKHGRGAVHISVRPTTDGLVALDVSDEGPPLNAEAWQLFRRDHDSHVDHGLGLPYGRRLAEAEGARLVLTAADPPTFSLLTPTE